MLWIVIGILLRIAVRTGAPRWAVIGAGVLFPISAIAAFVASAASFDLPGGWSILVPALLPPLLAGWAIWLRSPRLRALVTVERASLAALGAVAVVCAATIPLDIFDRLQMPARRHGGNKKRGDRHPARRRAGTARTRAARQICQPHPGIAVRRLPRLPQRKSPRERAREGRRSGAPGADAPGSRRHAASGG